MDACENEWLIKNCKQKCGLCQGIPLTSYDVFCAFISPPLHLVLQYIHSQLFLTLLPGKHPLGGPLRLLLH